MTALILTLLFVAQVPMADVSPTLGFDMETGRAFCDLNGDGERGEFEPFFGGGKSPAEKLAGQIEEDPALHALVLIAQAIPGGAGTVLLFLFGLGGGGQLLLSVARKRYKARNGNGPGK